MTTRDWLLVVLITWGLLLGFLAGAELANRHDRRMRSDRKRRGAP